LGRELQKRESLTPDAVIQGGTEHDDDYAMRVYDGVMLSDEEVAFVNEYIDNGFDAKAAYRAVRKVTGKGSDINGYAWRKKPHIQRAISDRLNIMGLSAEESLMALRDIAMSDWRDHVNLKMANGEIIDAKMDLSAVVRANEIILRAHNALDNGNGNQQAVVVNIVTPGLTEDELA
jgi:hypothetical protein